MRKQCSQAAEVNRNHHKSSQSSCLQLSYSDYYSQTRVDTAITLLRQRILGPPGCFSQKPCLQLRLRVAVEETIILLTLSPHHY